jgi:hypothetical protein
MKRRGLRKWDPEIGELVLVESGNHADASRAIIHNFQRPYEGPYVISKIVSPSIFEVSVDLGRPGALLAYER